jgi:hypothetical protein
MAQNASIFLSYYLVGHDRKDLDLYTGVYKTLHTSISTANLPDTKKIAIRSF